MRTERPNSLDNIDIGIQDHADSAIAGDASSSDSKPFTGHRALTIAFGIVYCIIFGVAMAFDVAFLPLFVPTLLFAICWFKSYRNALQLDQFVWYYGIGFGAFGIAIVMYQMFVSLLLNGIWPHDSTLSQKYVLSNFLYSFIGGGLGTEAGRYLLSKKIRSDRKDSEINTYLFVAMAGNVGVTCLILLLGNTGSLLKRVDTKIVETFVLGKAVLVRSILDSILQLLLSYRLEMAILRMGYYNRHNCSWNGIFALNIIIRGFADFSFFVVGLMNGYSGAGGLSGIYLAFILVTGLLVRRERKFLNVSFDPTLEPQTSQPSQQQDAR